jgi:hypothetical protein
MLNMSEATAHNALHSNCLPTQGGRSGATLELVCDRLAIAHRQPLKAGERQIEVTSVRMTEAGRKALEG